MIIIVISIASLIIIYLLRGTKSYSSIAGYTFCGSEYWVFAWLYIPVSLIIMIIIGKLYYNEYKEKLRIGYKFYITDIKYDLKTLIKINILGVIMGLCSALFGLGGGGVIAPVHIFTFLNKSFIL